MKSMGAWGYGVLVVASLLTACGPGADGSTEEDGVSAPAPESDGAKSAPSPAETLTPQKIKQHVD